MVVSGRKTAAAVPRSIGCVRMRPGGAALSAPGRKRSRPAVITVSMLCCGTTVFTRSSVCCSIDRVPVKVQNCLGRCSPCQGSLTGLNRSPAPPARMIPYGKLQLFVGDEGCAVGFMVPNPPKVSKVSYGAYLWVPADCRKPKLARRPQSRKGCHPRRCHEYPVATERGLRFFLMIQGFAKVPASFERTEGASHLRNLTRGGPGPRRRTRSLWYPARRGL